MSWSPQDSVPPPPSGGSYPPAPPQSPYGAPGPYRAPGEPYPTYGPGGPGGPGGAAPQDNTMAIVSFILGIFSVVALPIVGPVAIVLANKAVHQIDRAPGAYSNRGLAIAGRVLGIIGTVFLAVAIIAIIILVVAVRQAANGTTGRGNA